MGIHRLFLTLRGNKLLHHPVADLYDCCPWTNVGLPPPNRQYYRRGRGGGPRGFPEICYN